jgi:hypothetical protein
VQPRGLLEGRGFRPGRRGGFGGDVVDLVPDNSIVGTIGKACFQKRLDKVEVVVVRGDNGNQFEETRPEGATTGR